MLTGNHAYLMPPHRREARIPPGFVIVEILIKDPESMDIVELGTWILSPGDILPRLPGLYVNIQIINYTADLTSPLEIQVAPSELIFPELPYGIREMNDIVERREINWKLYRNVLDAIKNIRPQLITEALLATPPPSDTIQPTNPNTNTTSISWLNRWSYRLLSLLDA